MLPLFHIIYYFGIPFTRSDSKMLFFYRIALLRAVSIQTNYYLLCDTQESRTQPL